ncbi:LamG-like jellyroll fold domain-containing protein [Anaerobaca lacustris]|uniref:Discoidin domain-containing protein n=1 Tax=Anaerobaca lacustris TaxID=3044600 RepID=A0AAW6U637_9BACT|nr:discoidin domain-containing protein [Sedimentisphaerales bacterium M17dextr]
MSKWQAITLLLALGAMTVPAAAADPSLVLHLRFDEGAGTVAEDASIYRNNGTVVGNAQWVEGVSGTALEFVNGSHVTVPEIPQYDVTSEVSLMAWVKATTVPNWARVIDKSQWQTSGFDLVLTQNVGLPRLEFFVSDTTSLVDGTTVVIDNEWHFIAGTFGNKTLRVYVDGQLEGEGTSVNQVDINPNDWPIMIGGESSSNGGQQYLGQIDEVAMFDRELSAEEIASIFARGIRVPEMASNPNPQDQAVDVPRDVVLSWDAGDFAAAHDVYFGASFDDVNSAGRANPMGALLSQGQTDTTYDAGSLAFGQTYYWRVDEVNAAPDNTIFKGDIWSFTVEPYVYPISNIVATSNATSEPDAGPQKTVDGSGLNADDQHSTTNADMWAGTTGGAEPVWIQYEFDRLYKLHEMWVWNYNVIFEPMLGFGFKDVTVEYSADGTGWTALGDFQFAQGTARMTYAHNTTIDFEGIAARYVRLTANSAYGFTGQFGLSEVRFYYLPVHPREPQPADGATNVNIDAVLDWRSGREAAAHEVYLSTDEAAVADGTALAATVSPSSYDPPALDLDTEYFWKIVEVNEAEAIGAWEGDIWSFSTQQFTVIDDFESYTDDMDAQTTIFDAWLDGWVNGTGSTVGHLNTPFAEQTIVRSGRQSMPLFYEGDSRADFRMDVAQDWTAGGAATLVLYFRGDLNNGAGQLYVTIRGVKVSYDGGPAALTAPLWKQWNIDLASLGVNLRSVTELSIGVDGSGSGVVYIDDIRLYRVAPAVVTAQDPGAAGLVAHYAMENNVQDGSGNGYHGTAFNDPTYGPSLPGQGQALQLDGFADYVELPIGPVLSQMTDATFATWVDFSNIGGDWQRIFDFGTSSTTGYMFLCPRIPAGPIRFAITPAGGSESIIQTTTMLQSGWHHLAVVIDSASMQVQIYLDGNVAASGPTATLPRDLGNTTQNWLGRSQYAADAYFSGSLDEFQIYSRALSAGEVRYLVGDR